MSSYREGRVIWYNNVIDFGSVVCDDFFMDDRQYFFKSNHLFDRNELPLFKSELKVSFEIYGDYVKNLRCLN